MRILLTGATGFIGKALVDRFLADGDGVVATSRDRDRASRALPSAVRVVEWEPQAVPLPESALEGIDVVVHLLGESVAGRWSDHKKRQMENSRVLGTRHLVGGLENSHDRPRQLVSASAIGYYGQRGEEELTESAEHGHDFLAELCVGWENEALAAQSLGVRVTCMRTGLVMGRDGGALAGMLPAFRMGLGGPLGDGRQWWPWIHIDDVISMYVRAVREGWEGAWNLTAPEPVRQREFASTLGRVLRRPAFIPAPAFALRALLGEFSVELLASRKVVPERALANGFEFEHPRVEGALRDLVGR